MSESFIELSGCGADAIAAGVLRGQPGSRPGGMMPGAQMAGGGRGRMPAGRGAMGGTPINPAYGGGMSGAGMMPGMMPGMPGMPGMGTQGGGSLSQPAPVVVSRGPAAASPTKARTSRCWNCRSMPRSR